MDGCQQLRFMADKHRGLWMCQVESGPAERAELNKSRALLQPVTDQEPSSAGGANVFGCSGGKKPAET